MLQNIRTLPFLQEFVLIVVLLSSFYNEIFDAELLKCIEMLFNLFTFGSLCLLLTYCVKRFVVLSILNKQRFRHSNSLCALDRVCPLSFAKIGAGRYGSLFILNFGQISCFCEFPRLDKLATIFIDRTLLNLCLPRSN